MSQLKREKLFEGIYFNSILDTRFKTNRVCVNMVVPLDEENAAMNALTVSILRKGYEKHPDFTEFSKYLTGLYGSSIGYGVVKIGDNQVIKLSTSYIDDKYTLNNEKLSSEMLEVLFGVLLQPVFENGEFLENEVKIEKENQKDDILSKINEKRTYAISQAVKLALKDEPAGLSHLGTIEQVEKITPKDVTQAYKNLISQARIEVTFVGGGDDESIKALAKEKLATIERDYKPNKKTTVHLPVAETINHVEKMDVSQCKLVMGFAFDDFSEKDIAKYRAMVAVLGGSPTSKLFLNVREKLSLCYYCAARFDGFKGTMMIDAGVEKQNVEKAKDEILNQIKLMQNGEVTEEELNQEKMAIINSYKTVNDSIYGIGEYYLSGVVEDRILSPEEQIEQIEKVTVEDVCSFAKKLKLDIVYLLQGLDDTNDNSESED